jgi:hypothetical protein
MLARQSAEKGQEPQPHSKKGKGAEAYPYDPTLRLESQRGLDRLRCFSDRALAAAFFALFEAAERNTEEAITAERERAQKQDAQLRALRALATRAFDGELGLQPQELAMHLLLDERGARSTDEHALREFALALRQLRQLER